MSLFVSSYKATSSTFFVRYLLCCIKGLNFRARSMIPSATLLKTAELITIFFVFFSPVDNYLHISCNLSFLGKS